MATTTKFGKRLFVTTVLALMTLSAAVQAAPNNGGGSFKTKSALEKDGWSCKLEEGTTLTTCTKPGEGKSWSCNDRGMCTENFVGGHGPKNNLHVPLGGTMQRQ